MDNSLEEMIAKEFDSEKEVVTKEINQIRYDHQRQQLKYESEMAALKKYLTRMAELQNSIENIIAKLLDY